MFYYVKFIYVIKSRKFVGKKIVLVILGSIVVVECVKLVRELIRYGVEVYVVMSENVMKIIYFYVMEFVIGNFVVIEIIGFIEYVEFVGEYENKVDFVFVCFVIVNIILKIVCGIDDIFVIMVVIMVFVYIFIMIVLVMYLMMYDYLIVKENIEKLKKFGVEFIELCFEEGKVKVVLIEEIVYCVIRKFYFKSFEGKCVFVIVGVIREYIDLICYIINVSSGKMGVVIVEEVEFRGVEVMFICIKSSVLSFVEN